MKKITNMDFVTALLSNKEYEQNIVAFAKSNEAFKYEPKKEETQKVADDRLKGKHISDVSTYIPQRAIEVIVTNFNGKKVTLNGNDIFDGIYVDNKALGVKDREVKGKEIKGKGKQPKMVRTQFEEETFEFGNGGGVDDKRTAGAGDGVRQVAGVAGVGVRPDHGADHGPARNVLVEGEGGEGGEPRVLVDVD
jgi:hypothetical protein